MTRVSLKRILARKNGIGAVVAALLRAFDTPLGVEDVEGSCWSAQPDVKARTQLCWMAALGRVIETGGWLVGEPAGSSGRAEAEKKALADEVWSAAS
jgi:hypothetical protein